MQVRASQPTFALCNKDPLDPPPLFRHKIALLDFVTVVWGAGEVTGQSSLLRPLGLLCCGVNQTAFLMPPSCVPALDAIIHRTLKNCAVSAIPVVYGVGWTPNRRSNFDESNWYGSAL